MAEVVEILDVPVDQIRASPYQPRIYFDTESLQDSIEQDGLISTPTVRRKPDGVTEYELIDGERRLRSVKNLGWETVQVQVVDIDDETARRIVFTLNEERQPYNAEEYTKFFRKMYDEMGSYSVVARAFGKKSHNTIINYVNISILPEHFQKAIWAGKISVGIIQEMDTIFAEAKDEAGGVVNVDRYSNSQAYQYICSVLEELLLAESKKSRAAVKEQYIDPFLERLEGERVRRAKEEAEKIIPKDIDVDVDIESPNGLRKAAKALLDRAEELKSDEEILDEFRAKARKTLLTGRGNVKSKIEKASELGLDASEYVTRCREIEAKIEEAPEIALDEAKELKKDIDKDMRKQKLELEKIENQKWEAKIREEAEDKVRDEAQAKADEEIQKIKATAKEDVKQELQEDPEFRARIAQEERDKRLNEFKKKYEISEPELDKGKKYYEKMVSDFYELRGWGIPVLHVMGKKWWNETRPWIEGIVDWGSFLLLINPDMAIENQPKEPFLKLKIKKDQIVEAEYQILED